MNSIQIKPFSNLNKKQSRTMKMKYTTSHHTLQKNPKAINYNQLAVQRKLGRNMHDSKDKCDPKICKNGWDEDEPHNFNGDVGV